MFTVGQLAKKYGLSRSTLLYYDKIGLLKPTNRAEGQYRQYSAKDARRLEQICLYRQAGLTLKNIQHVLDSPKTKLAKTLENRLQELNSEMERIHYQQQLILGLLKNPQAHRRLGVMNAEIWTSLLKASGFSEEDMLRWHAEFERNDPKKHQKFLEFLGIPDEMIKQIRSQGSSEEKKLMAATFL